jgi:hypothetical protein
LFLLLIVQFVLALVVTASVMPIVLVNSPAAREGPIGMAIAGTILIGSFAVLWLVWPRRKRDSQP